MIELRHLKTFTVVADNLSFSKASKNLHMAQSSVSAQIKLLEEELSLKLFDRIGRRVIITEAGMKLYGYARRMMEMTYEIRSELNGSKSVRGNLTIRIPETLATVYMPGVVERFYKDNPQVTFNFINCTDDQLRRELNSGRIDVAFLMADSINLKEVNVEKLKTLDLVMVAGFGHSLVKKSVVKPDDLHQQTILLSRTDCSYGKMFVQSLHDKKIKHRRHEFSSLNSLQDCLKRGVGYSICPEVVVRKKLKDGNLAKINWNEENFSTSIIMIWHVDKWCSPLLKHFMKISKDLISDHYCPK